ncbi:MAG: CPBP family intramembrane glutamic endopeptidase [Candidatus Hodarchaeota archaeon]
MTQNGKKQIARKRMRFFYQEVVWGFILVFLFLLIPVYVLPLIVDVNNPLYSIIFYSLRAIFVFIGIPLIFPLSNLIFESQKRNLILEEDISPAIGHLKLYKISKKNYKFQILYGILIFFLVFLPIDFFGYLLIPGMLEYQAVSLPDVDIYLKSPNYFLFLISAIIIQFSVAITEETVSRGLLAKRGSEHFFRMSAVIISALYWGFGHFAYFLNPISRLYPIWYPFIWFFQSFFIGIILSLLVLRRKWIFPAIIAHTLNNIISAHAVWSFWQENSFTVIALYLYYPLLIIGVMLFVWYYSQIKEGLSIGFKMLKTYFKPDKASEETKGDTIFRVFFDILMGLLLFIMGFLILI